MPGEVVVNLFGRLLYSAKVRPLPSYCSMQAPTSVLRCRERLVRAYGEHPCGHRGRVREDRRPGVCVYLMGAECPDFLRYHAMSNPKHDHNKRTCWMASPRDAATLNELYKNARRL